VFSEFTDDEKNTPTQTVLTMLVGGGRFGGIHGAHMGPGVRIRYAASDKKRQTIPWVEYRNTETGATRTYLAGDAKPESVRPLPIFEMQCVDCHNRAAHSFDLPDRAVDRAMARGEIPVGLPFVKKTAVELLKASYASEEEAAQKIPTGLSGFYQQKYADIWAKRSNDVQLAGQTLVAIYRNNVFPDLKVTWGTYPNNLGHMDDPGCFRCHDDAHATADKKTIPQDCGTCHQTLASEEAAPAILKTLGLGEAVTSLQKQ
jgi:formate-dependent nitrite reductase cytochrome c552 subunit